MDSGKPWKLAVFCLLAVSPYANSQRVPFDRLPPALLDVTPPSARVSGTPGGLRVASSACRTMPESGLRRRIVDIAAQEWGFFGFRIVDQTVEADDEPEEGPPRWRFRRGNPEEAARIAPSIGGYWSATPEGPWMIERQNQRGLTSRWRDPWSAAFISWVMCESGLGTTSRFQRAIAHHVYIDQAIRARDGRAPQAAFVAYDSGESPIEPGDLLCSARRPAYSSIGQRRPQMGQGARSHCDIVVKVDRPDGRILAIGGNVGGRVSLKVMPSDRRMFAHLKLRADPIEPEALDSSPAMQAGGAPTALLE